MHKSSLNAFFQRYQSTGEPLVLGLVVGSSGSTYSKPGDCMLIDGEGQYHGMLSGGCLEGDLALRAAAVLDSGTAERVVYDLVSDDELWGLGVGCEGVIDVLLLKLEAGNGYQPYAALAAVFESTEPASLAVALESETYPAGAAAVMGDGGTVFLQSPDSLADFAPDLAQTAHGSRVTAKDGHTEVICLRVLPIPRLLLLGAGPDVVPLLNLARELGWHTTIMDHRPAFIERPELSMADERHCAPAAALGESLAGRHFDAAVVMSHHLDSDRHYLRRLADNAVAFVGLLGPPSRRDRLLGELGAEARRRLEPRLQAPVGLDLGGRGAASIALSICAGIEQYLNERAVVRP